MPQANITWVAEALRKAKARRLANPRGSGAAVLIGAGCSVSAKIPAAGGIIDYIRDEYRQQYDAAPEKTYPALMQALSSGEQRDVIAHFVDNAMLNWAHIALAQLIAEEYVTRVFTTNFDPLIMRACAMVGKFPAVYDLATSDRFDAEKIHEPAIFHLHGQRSGFAMLNTKKAVDAHYEKLRPVFDDARAYPWIVVGYSGDNDPVFRHLCRVKSYEYHLFWVGYRNNAVPDHVSEKLLNNEAMYAHHLPGFDADTFFVDLANQLGCFPPELIVLPCSNTYRRLEVLTPYRVGDAEFDLKEFAQQVLKEGMDQLEKKAAPLHANKLFSQGQYEGVIRYFGPKAKENVDLARIVARCHYALANRLTDSHPSTKNIEAAIKQYELALELHPEMHESLNNWGVALKQLALRAKDRDEQVRLFREALAKYDEALKLVPEKHEVLYNRGLDMSALGWLMKDDAMVAEAEEWFARAAATNPKDAQTLDAWGTAFVRRCDMATDAARRADFLAQAEAKYRGAEALAPGWSAYNLACTALRRNDVDECKRQLAAAIASPYKLVKEDVMNDPDLAAVHEAAWFKDLTDKIRP